MMDKDSKVKARRRKMDSTLRVATMATATTLVMAMGKAFPAYAQNLGQIQPAKAVAEGIAGVFLIILLIPIAVAAIACFALLWRGLFPRRSMWTTDIFRKMPWGSMFLGLAVTLVTLIIVAVLGNAGKAAGLLALIILSAYVMLLKSFAVPTIVDWAGEVIDPASSGIRRALLGSGALVLMLLIPLLGWLLLAGIGLMGIGAALVSYLPSRPATPMPVAGATGENAG